MKELLVVIALMNAQGANEETIQQHVIQSQFQTQDIITETVHIETSFLGAKNHEPKCWPARIYNGDGSFTVKVQCQ
jgi:hypothetical protein